MFCALSAQKKWSHQNVCKLCHRHNETLSSMDMLLWTHIVLLFSFSHCSLLSQKINVVVEICLAHTHHHRRQHCRRRRCRCRTLNSLRALDTSLGCVLFCFLTTIDGKTFNSSVPVVTFFSRPSASLLILRFYCLISLHHWIRVCFCLCDAEEIKLNEEEEEIFNTLKLAVREVIVDQADE